MQSSCVFYPGFGGQCPSQSTCGQILELTQPPTSQAQTKNILTVIPSAVKRKEESLYLSEDRDPSTTLRFITSPESLREQDDKLVTALSFRAE